MHVAVHFVSHCISHDAQHDFQAHAVLQSGLQGCDRDYSTVLLLVLAVPSAARDTFVFLNWRDFGVDDIS